MDLGIDGKTALVCGGSRGLGRAVAEEFAQEGCRVVICARDPERLRATTAEITQSVPGSDVSWVAADLAKPDEPLRLVAEVAKLSGPVDILIANAGGPAAGAFDELTPEQWQQALDLSLMSVVRLCQAATPGMRARGWGRVIAITSISAKQPIVGLMLSNAARAGVHGFLKSLANEIAADGVTVNAVCPSHTRTDRLTELATGLGARTGAPVEEVYADWAAANPTGRIGDPSELAAVVAFLASARASFVNGSAVAVDGGAVRGLG